jgi:large subunit ribosomal protein L32
MGLVTNQPTCTRGDLAMAVPKRKQSNARSGSRRAHDFLTPKQLHKCPKCGTMTPSHVVCPNANCGYYMGRQLVAPKVD